MNIWQGFKVCWKDCLYVTDNIKTPEVRCLVQVAVQNVQDGTVLAWKSLLSSAGQEDGGDGIYNVEIGSWGLEEADELAKFKQSL